MLIGVQVALTVLLLAGTGSAIRVLADLYQTRLGYDPLHVLAATIDLADGRHPEWQGRAAFYDRVRANIEALPGIQNVTLMVYGGLPPRFGFRTRIEVPGQQTGGASPIVHRIDSQFFSTLRIPIERGRMWTSEENARAAHVAVISQTMADRLWADHDAVGQNIRLPEFAESTSQFVVAAPGATGWFEIVGVVGDVPTAGLRAALEPVVYVPHMMMLGDSLTVLLRAEQDPATLTRSIRDAVHAADPNQPVNRIRSAEDVLAQAGWARERFVTFLLLGFGAFALMLAAVGLYSVVSYAVSRRTKEFGIRIALGARRLHIVRLSLDPTVLPIGVGLATGLMLSIVSSRVVSRWSIGTANDPLILAAVSLVLLATAAAATLVAAGRVATMAPNQSLRID
jgi:predicted permease